MLLKIFQYISSMKTGLILLVLVGLVSAMSSILLPNSFFQTLFFKLLLSALFLNMLLCTSNRFLYYKKNLLKNGQLRNRSTRQFGVLILHAGIVLILIGGFIYSTFGYSRMISISEGATVSVPDRIAGNRQILFNLDHFTIEFNEDGSPSQYYSYVTVFEDDIKKGKHTISVNHPLKYDGIKTYQQSFGYLVKAEYINAAGKKVEELFREGELLRIPGTDRIVKIYRYIPSFNPANGMKSTTFRPDNPRVIFSVYKNNKLLGVGAASFGEKVKIDNEIYIVFPGVKPFTILNVKSDPGLPLAAAGGLIFIIGTCFNLLSPVHIKRK